MKQMNPRFTNRHGTKIGVAMSEDDLEGFNDAQITQLYELFLETTRQNRIDGQSKWNFASPSRFIWYPYDDVLL